MKKILSHSMSVWALRLAVCVVGGGLLLGMLQGQAARPAASPAKPATTKPAANQSKAEIDAQIDKAGSENPAWWDSVKLNYPATLDLTWPVQPPTPGWNPQKNVNQYYITIVNPNPSKHQEGCKLMHHLLTVNKDNASVQSRGAAFLGRIYAIYLQDYARGAYWYRKAVKLGSMNDRDYADLAYCYWKLGSHDMALAELEKAQQVGTRTIRVMGYIGEVDKALALAKKMAGAAPEEANLAAGDVCRESGRYKEAISWYQKVAALPNKSNPRMKRYYDRAAADALALQGWELFDLKKIADGTYSGDSSGYLGPVKVDVTVKAGRIEDVKVVNNKDNWPLNSAVVIPAQVIEKQSIQGVDMVSGASFTSDAIISASAKALGGAAKK